MHLADSQKEGVSLSRRLFSKLWMDIGSHFVICLFPVLPPLFLSYSRDQGLTNKVTLVPLDG